MLVKNLTDVTLKCDEFGIRPFSIEPGEVKDIPRVVAVRWAAMNEKPIEIVGDSSPSVDEEYTLPAENVIEPETPEEEEEDEEVVTVPRTRKK